MKSLVHLWYQAFLELLGHRVRQERRGHRYYRTYNIVMSCIETDQPNI